MAGAEVQMKKPTRDAILQAVLYFVVIVLVNVVVSGWFFRLDLTRDKLNTLSPATEKLLKGLKDHLIVTLYFNSDLPSPYNANRQAIADMLQEFRSLSDGKLEYRIENPTTDKEVNKAVSEGVPRVQVQVINNDKMEVKRAFMGLVMEYQARRQIIPVIEHLSDFEYEMASRIERLTNPNKKTIAIAVGNGEPSFRELQNVQQALSHRYNLYPTNLSTPIPDSVSALIMIQPTSALADSQLYNLDQYMMNKGRAAFLMSMVNATMQSEFATNLSLNLTRLFKSYGFGIKKNLVRDAVCASVSMMQQEGGLTMQTEIPNPYIPIVSGLDRSFVVTQDLHQIILPFPSEVDTASADSLHLKVVPFAVSSARSGIYSGVPAYNLNPTTQFTREMFEERHLLLGVAISGAIHATIPDTGSYARAHFSRKTEGRERIIVMGCGNFVQDAFLNNPDNLSVFLNSVDYLTDNLGLISIRSKSFIPPPLKPVSAGTRATTKDMIVVLPPLIVLAFGLLYWRRTGRRRKAYRESLNTEGEPENEQVD